MKLLFTLLYQKFAVTEHINRNTQFLISDLFVIDLKATLFYRSEAFTVARHQTELSYKIDHAFALALKFRSRHLSAGDIGILQASSFESVRRSVLWGICKDVYAKVPSYA